MEWIRSFWNKDKETSSVVVQATPTGDKSDLDKHKGTTTLSEPLVKVSGAKLIENDKETQELYFQLMKKRGYVVVTAPPHAINAAEILENAAKDYFTQDMETKDKNQVSNLGMRANLGYVHVKGTREYIKLRPNDVEPLWPKYPTCFKKAYEEMYDHYSKLAWACFITLASHIDTTEGNTKPLLDPNTIDAVREFAFSKSSVSMIHYFSQTTEADVCTTHKDTGLLTFLLRTRVPSLEIWDKVEKKYIQAEKLCAVGDVFVYMGEKMPLFTGSRDFNATPHRVIMPPGTERISMAFLLDIAK
mmetsp:Transcript_5774/g.6277  ORF Transcript_5774/g.6277 Transcript_5774/m.6277 type:complete len:302 (+) Transcript_5774:26-931(+)